MTRNDWRRMCVILVIGGYVLVAVLGTVAEFNRRVGDLPDWVGVFVVAPVTIGYLVLLFDEKLAGRAIESTLDERELLEQRRLQAGSYAVVNGIVVPLAILSLGATGDHPSHLARAAVAALCFFCIFMLPVLPRLPMAWRGMPNDDALVGE
jgi:hypothetical protein